MSHQGTRRAGHRDQSSIGAPLTSGRWIAFSQKPAAAWQDAFPAGNGDHGTMPCGVQGQERVINIHGQLFLRTYDRKLMVVPDIVNPWPSGKVLVKRDGKAAETVEGERFTLKTKAGEKLELIARASM